MTIEVRHVEIRTVNRVEATVNRVTATQLESWEDETLNQFALSIVLSDDRVTSYDDTYFEAMCALRRELERHGLRLQCYGASLNVYPSPMLLDMGDGSKAYRLTLGKQAKRSDLVSIFDSGADVVLSTVDEQAAFYDRWLDSLGATRQEDRHG